MNSNIYWKYFVFVLKHKWYVLKFGLKLNVPIWNLIWHDWDKLIPYMFVAFANYNFGRRTYTNIIKYYQTCLDHFHRNRHHWNHWVAFDVMTFSGIVGTPMDNVDLREMMADWGAAHVMRKTPGSMWDWYKKNEDKIKLHSDTRYWIETNLPTIQREFIK